MMQKSKNSKGLTLVELVMVIVIIGVLAAFAVPRFRDAVERSKASEAFNYLAAVRASMERYHARQGTYADKMAQLDIKMTVPEYFTVGTIACGTTGSLKDSWTLTLTRSGVTGSFGPYTVTFTEEGFDATKSTIAALPDINPIAT